MIDTPSILIVDSNKAFATMLRESLEQEGHYHAIATSNGDEALQALSVEGFDLAIVDMGLEDPGGAVVAREMRQQQADLRLMLIPLEGDDVPPALADLSVQGTLTKPFFLPDLPDHIEQALTRAVAVVEDPAFPETLEPSEASGQADADALEEVDVPSDRIPEIAQVLRRLSREINAEAVVLTHGEDVLASAGRLQAEKLNELAQVVAGSWRASARMAQILGREQLRFEQSVEGGEYVFYSLAVAEETILSIALRADTPLGIIRHQAKRTASKLVEMVG